MLISIASAFCWTVKKGIDYCERCEFRGDDRSCSLKRHYRITYPFKQNVILNRREVRKIKSHLENPGAVIAGALYGKSCGEDNAEFLGVINFLLSKKYRRPIHGQPDSPELFYCTDEP